MCGNGGQVTLGIELFDEVDKFVCQTAPCFNRFDYQKDWAALKRWLGNHKNPIVAESYRSKQLEYLFTVFDLAWKLRISSLGAVLSASKRGKRAIVAAEKAWKDLAGASEKYQKYRRILLWALEAYLDSRHDHDVKDSEGAVWDNLRTFGRKVRPGDVILTFNYDSTLERVLWQQGKWSPKDGYGFEVVFQKSYSEKERVDFPVSPVKTLHLHGSVGWYRRPALRAEYVLRAGGGAIPPEALTPAPLDTLVALDLLFLRKLGIPAVDASLTRRPSSERQVFLHPSFLKDFEQDDANTPFMNLWRQAEDVLRAADEVAIIGYSLPEADSAALTLLLCNCDPSGVTVVNRNKATNRRLLQLLARGSGKHWLTRPAVSFEEWLGTVPDFPG